MSWQTVTLILGVLIPLCACYIVTYQEDQSTERHTAHLGDEAARREQQLDLFRLQHNLPDKPTNIR